LDLSAAERIKSGFGIESDHSLDPHDAVQQRSATTPRQTAEVLAASKENHHAILFVQ
jgi:hypothetical protein